MKHNHSIICLKAVPCNGCELMEDEYHEHCPECDCVLTWLEGDICRWCEERIEKENS